MFFGVGLEFAENWQMQANISTPHPSVSGLQLWKTHTQLSHSIHHSGHSIGVDISNVQFKFSHGFVSRINSI